MKHFLYRLMLINAIWSLVFQPFTIYAGGITPDGSTNTQVIAAPNGTPIVNISAPSSGGVSHNKFIDYNVGKDNLILNNSNVNGHSSNLGGILPGNSNLNNGHAGVILNEVTSSNRSILEGYTEISGNSAALIIANPNGITCNGCGFLNTDRTSLVTGRPEFDEYGIKGFNLSPDGYIEINGRGQHNLGFDGGASAADIVSRAVKINGNIFSDKDVNILTGNNHYSYRDNRVSSDLTYTEGVAVDSTVFGGIYAGRIRIVGTEKGFGINVNNLMGLKNGMVADADEITITADGKVEIIGEARAKDIAIDTAGVVNKGTIYSGDAINIKSSSDVLNVVDARLLSEKDLNISSSSFENQGEVISSGKLVISSDSTIVNNGKILSGGSVNLSSESIYNKVLVSNGSISMQTGVFTNISRLESAKDINITSKSFQNDGRFLSLGETSLLLDQNFASGIGFMNNLGGTLYSGGKFTLYTDTFSNKGVIEGADSGLIKSIIFDNFESGRITFAATHSIEVKNIDISGEFNNSGRIESGKDAEVKVDSKISNTGSIISGGNLTLTSRSDLTNTGEIVSANNLEIKSTSIDNKGKVHSGVNLNLSGSVLQNSGQIEAAQNMRVATAVNLINRGKILSGGNKILTGTTLDNKGTLASNGDITLNYTQSLNNSASIWSGARLNIKSDRFNNYKTIEAINSLNATFNHIDNNGRLFSGKNFYITTVVFNNYGSLESAGSGTLQVKGDYTHSGNTGANGKLSVFTGKDKTLINLGKLFAGDLELISSAFENRGTVQGGNNLKVDAKKGILNHANAQIISSGNIALKSAIFLNKSKIESAGVTQINTAGDFVNDARILAIGGLSVNAAKIVNNFYLGSAANIVLKATGDVINNKDIQANSGVGIEGKNVTNNASIKSFGKDGGIFLKFNSFINNKNVNAAGDISLEGGYVKNEKDITSGKILSSALRGGFTNTGDLAGAGGVSLRSYNFNNYGSVESGADLYFKTEYDLTNYKNSVISSKNNMFLQINRNLINFKAHIESGGDMLISGTGGWLEKMRKRPDAPAFLAIDENYGRFEKGVCVAGSCFGGGGYPSSIFTIDKNFKLENNQTEYSFISENGYSFDKYSNLSNLVQNIGGIIHSKGSTEINTAKLQNMSTDKLFGLTSNNIILPYRIDYSNARHIDVIEGYNSSYMYDYSVTSAFSNDITAVIKSENNIKIIAENIKNSSGIISAKNDLDIDSYKIVNSRPSSHIDFEVNYYGIIMDTGECMSNYNAHRCYGFVGNDHYLYRLYSLSPSVISSGRNMVIRAEKGVTVDSPSANTPQQPLGGNINQKDIKNPVGNIAGIVKGFSPVTSVTGGKLNLGNGDIRITVSDSGEWSFSPGDMSRKYEYNKPDSNYLFESRSKYIDKDEFLGSDYFLELIGAKKEPDLPPVVITPPVKPPVDKPSPVIPSPVKPQKPVAAVAKVSNKSEPKFLGDAYTETQIIMNDILRSTGQQFISGAASAKEQMKILYDNAASGYRDLGLVFGKALTASQLSRLDKDIIWYETKMINGVAVYAPVLYIGKNTAETLGDTGSSRIVAGGNMSISAGSLLNYGTISSGGNMQLSAKSSLPVFEGVSGGSIVNYGNISSAGNIGIKAESLSLLTGKNKPVASVMSGGNMNLDVSGTLLNSSSLIKSAKDMGIKAGSLISQTNIETVSYTHGYRKTGLASVAAITSGGNMAVEAGDITLTAAKVSSEGNMYLEAKNSVSIGGATTEEDIRYSSGRKEVHIYNTTFHGSEITSGGNQVIKAGEDINITGSKVKAKENVSLVADGEVNLLAGQNTHTRTETKTKSGFFSSSKSINITGFVKNIVSEVSGGGNVSILSGDDITTAGSSVSAGEDAIIEANGEIKHIGVNDIEFSYSKKSKSSFGGLISSSDMIKDMSSLYKGGNAKAVGSMSVISGGNTYVKGSSLESGGDMTLAAGFVRDENGKFVKSETGGSVIHTAGQNVTTHEEEHVKTNFTKVFSNIFKPQFVCKGAGCSASVEIGEYERNTAADSKSVAVVSTVTSGGNLNVLASKEAVFEGSDILVGKNALFKAEKVILDTVQNREKSSQTSEKAKLSLTAGVGNNYVDAVHAAKDVVKAAEAVDRAKGELNEAKRLHREGKITGEALDHAHANLAAATLNAGTAAIGAAASARTAHDSDTFFGFYGNAGLSADVQKSSASSESTADVITNINAGGNISFQADSMHQKGAIVRSANGNINYDITDNLNILAAKNTSKTSGSSEKTNVNVGIKVGSSISPTAGFNGSYSGNDANNLSHGNAKATAKNGSVNFNVGGDMAAEGFNASADYVDINIKGKLVFAGVQNESQSSGKSLSIGGSVSGSSVAGNIGKHTSSSGRVWTNEASSITATSGVTGNVGGALVLHGSKISNEKDGEDLGNLNIKAGSVELNDLSNKDSSSNGGFSAGTSVSPGAGYVGGTSSIGLVKTGYEKEGLLKAVIGKGNLETADASLDLGINRDIANTDVVTKDKITGTLNADIKVDNRIFSPAGWSNDEKRHEKYQGQTKHDKDGNPIELDRSGTGILDDFTDFFNNADRVLTVINPISGSKAVYEETGAVPYMKPRIEMADINFDERFVDNGDFGDKALEGSVYVKLDSSDLNQYVSVYGKEVIMQNGTDKVVKFVELPDGTTEGRLYLVGSTGEIFSDSNKWTQAVQSVPGMVAVSQVHDRYMQEIVIHRERETGTKESADNELIKTPELAITGIATFFVNAYYAPGTLINRIMGDKDMDNAYKKMTGPNLVDYGTLPQSDKGKLNEKAKAQADIEEKGGKFNADNQ